MSLPLRHHSAFPGTIDGAAGAATWLRNIAARELLSDKLAFALEVCLEELFTNVVRHGGGGHWAIDDAAAVVSPLSIRTALIIDSDAVDLVVEDNGKSFDVSQAPASPVGEPIEDLAPGGLGMQLIRSFSNDLRYEPLPNGNRVIVNFLRPSRAASTAEA